MMITLAYCVQEICTHPFFIVLGEAKGCPFNTFSIRTGGATLKHNIVVIIKLIQCILGENIH